MNLPLEGRDYYVRVMSFGGIPIPAFIRLNPGGESYSLYLNADVDFDHQLDGYTHELLHMARDDMLGDKSILDIEEGLRNTA